MRTRARIVGVLLLLAAGSASVPARAAAVGVGHLAWGRGDYGQLGTGCVCFDAYPRPIVGVERAIEIAAGGFHSIAALPDGSLRTWGYNGYGQLGDGTLASRSQPGPVYESDQPPMTFTAVAAGAYHSLALRSDGTVWAWGWNAYGQLGDGSRVGPRRTPNQVADLANVIAIAAGNIHSLALRSDGTVWAWGYNREGEIGDGTTADALLPVQVKDQFSDPLTDVTAIAAGTFESYAVLETGAAVAWGYNASGQLGDNTSTDHATAQPVLGLSGVTKIVSRGSHTLALRDDGTVWAWGHNADGQLGDGRPTDAVLLPQQIDPQVLPRTTDIAAGWKYSLALSSDGRAWGWGLNESGVTLGPGFPPSYPLPREIAALEGASEIVAGDNHNFAYVPPIAITSPVDGGYAASSTVRVQGTAARASTVSLDEILDNGTRFLGSVTADEFGRWSITKSSMAEGEHAISASMIDDNGTVLARSIPVAFEVDSTPPNVSFVAPQQTLPGVTILAGATTVSARASDEDSGIGPPDCPLRTDPCAFAFFVNDTMVPPDQVSYTGDVWSFTYRPDGAGQHTLTARTTNGAGQEKSVSLQVLALSGP